MKSYALLLALVFSLSVGSLFSQSAAESGTFQLMTTNVKAQEVFTNDILVSIEAARHATDMVVLKVGTYTWARIPSLATINDPNFTPFSEEIIAIDPDDSAILNTTNNPKNQ